MGSKRKYGFLILIPTILFLYGCVEPFDAETETFGVLRMVVNKPEAALTLLKENGFTARRTSVLAVEVGNEPGSLARIVGIFDVNNANVEYMYAFAHTITDKALLVFKIEDFENWNLFIKTLQKAYKKSIILEHE